MSKRPVIGDVAKHLTAGVGRIQYYAHQTTHNMLPARLHAREQLSLLDVRHAGK